MLSTHPPIINFGAHRGFSRDGVGTSVSELGGADFKEQSAVQTRIFRGNLRSFLETDEVFGC